MNSPVLAPSGRRCSANWRVRYSPLFAADVSVMTSGFYVRCVDSFHWKRSVASVGSVTASTDTMRTSTP